MPHAAEGASLTFEQLLASVQGAQLQNCCLGSWQEECQRASVRTSRESHGALARGRWCVEGRSHAVRYAAPQGQRLDPLSTAPPCRTTSARPAAPPPCCPPGIAPDPLQQVTVRTSTTPAARAPNSPPSKPQASNPLPGASP